MSEIFDRFKALRVAIRPYDTKKDLLRASIQIQKEYHKFRAFLSIDGRFAPKRTREEFNKYSESGLKFKGEALKYDTLLNDTNMNESDKYKSSQKLVSIVTNAMVKEGVTLNYIHDDNFTIDIAYKKQQSVFGVAFELNEFSFSFMQHLPSSYYINIRGSSYNKNGLDFLHDYHNQSEDFTNNLAPEIFESKKDYLIIYKR